MDVTENYALSLLGLLLMVATLLVQSVVGAVVKGSQPGAVPGKMSADLSHDSLVFRTQRTFMNSLENTPAMLATGILAILAGVSPAWCAVLIWGYAIARLFHMVLYYGIATEKNPSPRSYFYLLGLVCNLALIGFAVAGLF